MEANGARGLDPTDWDGFRRQAHRMLDDILDRTANIRHNPVWKPVPEEIREHFRREVPRKGAALELVHETFLQDILPYGSGNTHPGFMGWVQGGGTPVGILAEMLAAGLNANLGGRDHAPLEVERQVPDWVREVFGFPRGSTGLFVSGTSMANLMAAVVSRDPAVKSGLQSSPRKLIAYASTAVHGCIGKALDVIGIGSDSLRLIRTDSSHRIDIHELDNAIAADRRGGLSPFLIVGTAGTVDVGAIEDLTALADVAEREKTWFHVDGAYWLWESWHRCTASSSRFSCEPRASTPGSTSRRSTRQSFCRPPWNSCPDAICLSCNIWTRGARWKSPQVPRHDDRRSALSPAPGHLERLEDSLLQC